MRKIKFNKTVLLGVFLSLLVLLTKNVNGFATKPANIMSKFDSSTYGKKTEFNLPSSVRETFQNMAAAGQDAIVGSLDPEYRLVYGGGAIADVGNLITQMYINPPVSSITYFADVGKNLGIIKPAFAQQGIGFTSLQPVLSLWKTFRNVSYVLFVLIFVWIGISIMFRVKISPQAVVTIQNSLPKLVIGLILVTFSYAIVGLLMDFMYIVIYLIASVIREATIGQTAWMNPIFDKAFSSFGDYSNLLKLIGTTMVVTVGALPKILILFKVPIVGLIVGCIILYTLFRIFLQMLQAYVGIITSVIFAPFQILFSSVPTSKEGVGKWFKNLMANILVIPTVFAMFLLAGYFLSLDVFPQGNADTLQKIKDSWDVFKGITQGGEGVFISLNTLFSWASVQIIGLGLFLLTPKIIELVKNAMQIKGPDYGLAIMDTVKGGYGDYQKRHEGQFKEYRAREEAYWKAWGQAEVDAQRAPGGPGLTEPRKPAGARFGDWLGGSGGGGKR